MGPGWRVSDSDKSCFRLAHVVVIEVAGSDPVMTDVETGSACAGIRQEPPDRVGVSWSG